jgi:hypothetical protein
VKTVLGVDGPRTWRREEGDDVRSTVATFVEDFLAEGPDVVAAHIADRAGASGVSIAAAYHASRDVFPHDPHHRVRYSEPGTVLFHPTGRRYAGLRIQPRVAAVSADRDTFREACAASRERGLDVTGWTVFLHTDRDRELADLAPENAFGDRYLADVCPSRSDVRAYALALAEDVAATGVSVVDAESLHYAPFDHGGHHERSFVPLGETARFLLALCFCSACLGRAADAGVDGAAVRAAVRSSLDAWLGGAPEPALDRDEIGELAGGQLAGYLASRTACVSALVGEVAAAVRAQGATLRFCDLSGALKGYASGAPSGSAAAATSWTLGVDLPAIAATGTLVGALGYTADAERLRLDLAGYTHLLDGRQFGLTLRPMLPDAPDAANLRAKVVAAREFPVAELSFYHYGLARLEALDWIRESLAPSVHGEDAASSGSEPASRE